MDVRGLKFLKTMTKDELIEEILAYQKATLEGLDISQLKAHVVDFRSTAFRNQLVEEAGMRVELNMFGHIQLEDKDD